MCQGQNIGEFLLCQEKQRDKYILLFDFENYKIIKRKLHRGEVFKSWVPFHSNMYHISKFAFNQDGQGLAVQTA